ncbi:hypothetical protein [Alkalicoccus chagannorensis]|uniref:hypothetical protein n=1 Tax=Alkalicoccus chagannorensis TaxID=427072 RepID=UPI00040CDCD2|nr:hypothetical protein [Alkalicoccus chagannorensis]
MFTVLLFRIVLLAAVAVLIYSVTKYFIDPKRRLERARRREDFYVLDDSSEVRRNILITVKGALFEGEKFLGPADHSVEVTSIKLQTEDSHDLQGMTARDFDQVEQELLVRYPKASIEWRQPAADIKRQLERRADKENDDSSAQN